jgi:hypothetical protein
MSVDTRAPVTGDPAVCVCSASAVRVNGVRRSSPGLLECAGHGSAGHASPGCGAQSLQPGARARGGDRSPEPGEGQPRAASAAASAVRGKRLTAGTRFL